MLHCSRNFNIKHAKIMPSLPLTTSVTLCFYSRTESFGLLDKPSFQYDHSDDPVSIKSRHKD
jgi:hypothetical protein